MASSFDDKCQSCGHEFESHTDRAIYPPCEADFHNGDIRSVASGEFPYSWDDRPAWIRARACFCKGFQSDHP